MRPLSSLSLLSEIYPPTLTKRLNSPRKKLPNKRSLMIAVWLSLTATLTGKRRDWQRIHWGWCHPWPLSTSLRSWKINATPNNWKAAILESRCLTNIQTFPSDVTLSNRVQVSVAGSHYECGCRRGKCDRSNGTLQVLHWLHCGETCDILTALI